MAYADNITITSTHTSTSAAKKYIQPYLDKLLAWTKQNISAHLHHTLAILKRYFLASLVAPLPNSEQINTLPQIIHTQSGRQNTSITTIPLCSTPTHTQHISSAPTYHPGYHPWISRQTPLEGRNCWPDGRRSWLVDLKREDRTPPTNMGQGSG